MAIDPPGYCERCWSDVNHLTTHTAREHNACYPCDREFGSLKAVEKHFVSSPEHDYCQLHDNHFRTYSKYREHVERFHEHYCEKCDFRVFKTRAQYEQHLESSPHHYWCRECDHEFSSEHNYLEVRFFLPPRLSLPLTESKHMNASNRHVVADVICPFCDDVFISRAARMIHIDKQWCPSGPTAEAILAAVQRVDPNGILAPSPRCAEEDLYHCALTDIYPRNGRKVLACYRVFNSVSSLFQHLHSNSCDASKTARICNMEKRIEVGILNLG